MARAGLSRLLSVYGSAASQLTSVEQSLQWSPYDPEAHHARARILADMGEDVEALREFEHAVQLRPLDYYLWLELGHAREMTADGESASMAFSEAVRLAPDYAQTHWQLGNYLLREGEHEAAFGAMRQAVASDATLFPALIDLAWGASAGHHEKVLQALQPQTDHARLVLARFFVAHQAVGAALSLFRALESPIATEERRALVSELLDAGYYPEAHEVWVAGVSRHGEDRGILFDGGFEREISAEVQGFGWQPFRGAQTIHFALDSRDPHSGARSLRLEYGGNFAPSMPIISQLVLVKAHTRYRLTFATRTRELVTAGLPRVLIRNADNEREMLSQSATLPRGTNEWRDEAVDFVTPETARAVLLCIQRQTCDIVPCPIFGQAWFDSFMLEEL